MRPRLSYANVMATIAVFIALGGSAYAFHLGKNSVGAKQLKKNAVLTAKVKNEAITAAKIKKGTLTGAQVDSSTLGTVPTARTAELAQTANMLSAPEEWHEVTNLINGWHNLFVPPGLLADGPVAYYKDQTGLVHLIGSLYNEGGEVSQSIIFNLPPGYRPGVGKALEMAVPCNGSGCPDGVAPITIGGTDSPPSPVFDGAVRTAGNPMSGVSLDGLTFRAES